MYVGMYVLVSLSEMLHLSGEIWIKEIRAVGKQYFYIIRYEWKKTSKKVFDSCSRNFAISLGTLSHLFRKAKVFLCFRFIFISSGFLSHWNSSFPHLHYNDFLANISPFKYSKFVERNMSFHQFNIFYVNIISRI